MLDSFRTLFGGLAVKETETEIIISGVRGHDIIRDINKYWKTTKIAANLFNNVNRNSISFYKFFAPEVMYMLENIVYYRSRYTSVKMIASIKDALMQETWLANTKPIDPGSVPGRLNFDNLKRLKFTPEAYQLDYFKNYTYRLDQYDLNGDLIAAAAGTGKTYMTSAIAEMLNAELIIVICPRNAVDTVWVDSINEMFHEKQSIWHSFDSKPYKGQRWIVCHYEAMDRVVELLRNRAIVGTKRTCTILDESHNLNDPNSARTKAYQLIVKAVGSRNNLLASGTPVKALGSELINLLRIVDPLFTPAVEERFRKMYGKEASKGLDIIRHRMGIISYKIEKGELDVQPPIMRPYPIKIPNGELFTLPAIRKDMEAFIKERWEFHRKRRPADDKFWAECIALHRKTLRTRDQERAFSEYLSLVQFVQKSPDPRFAGEEIKATNQYEKLVFGPSLPKALIHQFRDVKSVIKYTHLKIQGECLGRVLGGKRIEAHVAMVPYVDWVGIVESTHKKTIMFTSFVEAVEASDAHCVKLGMKPLAVYGKTANELADIVKRFDSNKELNPLNATYASLSTAVRLTMADTLILLNSPFRAYILEQAISRAYRMGQDSQVVVYQCSLDTGEIPNISTRSADILKWSQDQVEAIMGIKSPFEMGEAMEDYGDETEFDENKVMHQVLQKAFEQFDIEISLANFEVPKPKSNIPAYLR